MSLTKGELRSVARRFLDEASPESWTEAAIDEFINIAYEMRRAQIIGVHRLDFVRSYDYTFPANTDAVTYEDIARGANAAQAVANADFDVQEFVFIEDISDAANPVEVAYCPWIRRNEVLAAAGTRVAATRRDVGYYWSHRGREFWIIRRSSVALSLRLHVVPPFKPFGIFPRGDQDRPEFTVFNRILAIDAAIYARESVGDDLKNLGPLQERLEYALVRAYEERIAQEPDFINATDQDFTGGRGAV